MTFLILDTILRPGDDVRMTTYGFIGLGSMGAPMAKQLAAQCVTRGDRLLVWNRSPARDATVVSEDAITARDPADLVMLADVVIVMLPALPQLLELTDGPAKLLSRVQSPTVVAICSSVSPADARAFAAHASELTDGLVQVIDAPVSGGPEGAQAGALAIMVGGSDEAVAVAWPALTAMGRTVRHLGAIGAGSLAKACNQMVVAATMIALSEASVLAESAGVDVLAGGYATSRVLEVKAENLVSQTYSPAGKAAYMVKDLGFVRAESQRTGVRIDQADLSLATFAAVDAAGLGEQDMSVVHRVIRDQVQQLGRADS
jgi:2-hydroxy-3-oxopropionate reductase